MLTALFQTIMHTEEEHEPWWAVYFNEEKVVRGVSIVTRLDGIGERIEVI